jgi:hypothetical protein
MVIRHPLYPVNAIPFSGVTCHFRVPSGSKTQGNLEWPTVFAAVGLLFDLGWEYNAVKRLR